jgi:hypothetical protein
MILDPKNYIEAGNMILAGYPVDNLDKLRKDYNKRFDQFTSSLHKNKIKGYTPESIIVSFVADAENKILLGEITPDEAYSITKSSKFRESGRKILEHWLNKPINEMIFRKI